MEGPHNDRKSANRGWLNYVVTKILVGKDMTAADFVNLGVDTGDTAKDADGAYLLLDRSRLLRLAAKQVSQKLGVAMDWEPLPLSVFEYDGYKNAGPVHDSDSLPAHTHCERQGRCILGCLPRARHTLNKTLFKKVLKNPGVTLMPKCKVLQISQVPGGYQVVYEDRFTDKHAATATAPQLFLAGGVLID
jgi:hypothetical protein